MPPLLARLSVRKEDPALLSGRGRYADDLPVPAGTLHAHVIRSPHPHADIVRIDAAEALAKDGVWAVITGEDVQQAVRSVPGGAQGAGASMVARRRPRALCRRAGRAGGGREPLSRRGRRRTGADRIRAARGGDRSAGRVRPSAPILHPEAKTNEISVRKFTYGDTKTRIRAGRCSRRADGRLSAAVVHADGMLRRRRAIQSRRRRL